MQRYTLQSIERSRLQFTRMEMIWKCLLLRDITKKIKSWFSISVLAGLLTQETVSLIQPILQGYLLSNWMDLVQSGNIDPNIDIIHMNPPAGRAGFETPQKAADSISVCAADCKANAWLRYGREADPELPRKCIPEPRGMGGIQISGSCTVGMSC